MKSPCYFGKVNFKKLKSFIKALFLCHSEHSEESLNIHFAMMQNEPKNQEHLKEILSIPIDKPLLNLYCMLFASQSISI